MRIILIQSRGGYWDAIRDRPIAPLGILAAAALARLNHEVFILDERTSPDIRKDLDRLITGGECGLVGFTAYSGPLVGSALSLTRYVKSISNVPVVWGGVHPSLAPAQTVAHPAIDYVVQGEGEVALSRLADALAAGDVGGTAAIPGVWTFLNGRASLGAPPETVNLDELPMVPYGLVRMEDYFQSFLGKEYLAYQVSRGCDRGCAYCYNAVFNKGVIRHRAIPLVLDDLDSLRSGHGFEGVYFLDDNLFSLGKEKIFELAEALRRRGLLWYVQGAEISHLAGYTAAEFLRLEKSGLVRLTIGIESGSPRIRNLLNKRESLDEIKAVVERLACTSIRVWTNYITNLPTETLDDLRLSIDLIYRLRRLNPNVRNSSFYRFQPVSGTALARRFGDRISFPDSLEGWAGRSWESMAGATYADYPLDEPFFRSLTYTSMLSDGKFDEFFSNRTLRLLARLYRPLANYRLRRLRFGLPLDTILIDRITRAYRP